MKKTKEDIVEKYRLDTVAFLVFIAVCFAVSLLS